MLTQQELDQIRSMLLSLSSGGSLPPYLLGTQLDVQVGTIDLSAVTAGQIVGADPNRVLLMVGLDASASSANVRPVQMDATTGFAISNSGGPLVLTAHQHGILPQLEWWMDGAGGVGKLVWIVSTWRPPA